MEDLFLSLSGGMSFTKLDMAREYRETKKYTTILIPLVNYSTTTDYTSINGTKSVPENNGNNASKNYTCLNVHVLG